LTSFLLIPPHASRSPLFPYTTLFRSQARASLPLTTVAERAAKTKAFARSRFEQARQALQQRDFATAQKFIDEADASDPNQAPILDRKSTRLNSSHGSISYAVFCLKKK